MASFVINNVNVDITPYSQLSGRRGDFTSAPGSGVSKPITVTLSPPVSQFSVVVHDPDFNGNYVIGYDSTGVEIARYTVVGDTRPGVWTSDTAVLNAPSGKYIASVLLQPAPADYVAYGTIILNGAASVPVPTPTSSTPPPPPPPAPVNLQNIIRVDRYVIDKQYQHGSLQTLTSERVRFTNIDSGIDVRIQINSLPAVICTPAQFTVNRNSSQDVIISFDSTKLELLPDGLNSYTIPFALASQQTSTPQPPTPTVNNTPPPPPVVSPPTPVWKNGVTHQQEIGYPPTGWVLASDGWYYPPVVPPVVTNPPVTSSLPLPPIITNPPPPTPVSPATGSLIDPPITTTPPAPTPVTVTTGSLPLPPITTYSPPPTIITPDPTIQVWMSGLDNTVQYGSPPAGWVQDPYSGSWYPADHPYVLNGFNTPPTGGGGGGSSSGPNIELL